MTKLAMTILIITVAALAASAGLVYSGLYNVGADVPHGKFADWLLSTTSQYSIERRASGIDVPDLTDSKLRLAGANDFEAMCAGCHGAPGQKPSAIGRGLNPPPPDLAESSTQMTAAQLFWVTKHGIRMTGMPAWSASHDDDALWPVVAFMKALPELSADDYQALLTAAAGIGHHGSVGGVSEKSPAAGVHDHSAHSHGAPNK